MLTGCSSLFYYPSHQTFVDFSKSPAYTEDVRFTSETGVELDGRYFCPNPCHNQDHAFLQKPLVIQFHGNAQNLSTHFFSLYWLTQNDYDYFIFDYAGYGASQGSPSPRETLADGKAALRWATRRFPGRPLVLVGQSLGGAIALRVAIENQVTHEFPVALVVVESTFDSYEAIGAEMLSRSWVTWIFQPLAYVLLSDRYAPGKDIGKISPTPLIVIHGQKDPIVPFRFGQRVFDAATQPKEFWTYAEAGHVISSQIEDGKFNQRLFQKLEEIRARSN